MSRSKVAIVRTSPATVLEDYHRLMNLAGYQEVIDRQADTALKVNISWHFFYPASSTTPWQLEGVIRAMKADGYDPSLIHACHNRTVVIDAHLGERENKQIDVVQAHGLRNVHLYEGEPWIPIGEAVGDLTKKFLCLNEVYPKGFNIPRRFIGENIIHLPTVKTHIFTTTTGAMKNAFGGLLNEHRHWTHPVIHETLVDLLMIQKKIHRGVFAVMDGTFAGDGPGPRCMIPHVKNVLLASADQVAIDAVAAKLMGMDPMRDCKFVRLAHDLGLGCGDVRDIEIVGDVDAADQNWHFDGPFKNMTFASRNQHRIYWGPLKKPVEWSLKTWLAPWAYVASVTYHDMFWYPFKGQQHIQNALRSEWGRLFANWGKVQPDAEGRGYPDVGEANAELVRLGVKHFLEASRLIGMAVAESPEVLQRRRRAAQGSHPLRHPMRGEGGQGCVQSTRGVTTMQTVCVTGTNGKTTTTSMVAAIVAASGEPWARVTTLGAWVGDEQVATEATSEAFAELVRRAGEAGVRTLAVETTSQALSQGFAAAWPAAVGVFTNLSRDHLDYHGTPEQYLAAKAQLFLSLGEGGVAVLNAADPACALLDEVTPAHVRRLWYAARPVADELRGVAVDLQAARVEVASGGTRVVLEPSELSGRLGGELTLRLVGEVHAENALAAALAGLALGYEGAVVARGLEGFEGVPGRFQIVSRSPLVAVDYAHTPDALEKTLRVARGLVAPRGGRVVCVFGCGGNRDRGKRPEMGAVAARLADVVVLTTDNPRDERPEDIAAEVLAGVPEGAAPFVVEPDRERAIAGGIGGAGSYDIVVITGKGHERTQTVGEQVLPFDDVEVARGVLRHLDPTERVP